MSKDKLITCPRCGSDACYETQETPNLTNRICYGCGFMTHNYMKEDSLFLEEQLESLPHLYRDITFIDDNKYHWIPSTINLPDKGMVYVNGTSIDNWKWVAVKAIPLLEEELNKFPENATHKMDMKNSQEFSERDYMEALDYIGVFNSVK